VSIVDSRRSDSHGSHLGHDVDTEGGGKEEAAGVSKSPSVPPARHGSIYGVPLDDFQLNLSYVVDELVTRQHQYEKTLRARRRHGEVVVEDKDKPGGWMGLYLAFRQAKQKLIQAGTQPEDVPAALASYASQKDFAPPNIVNIAMQQSPLSQSSPAAAAAGTLVGTSYPASVASNGANVIERPPLDARSVSMPRHPFSTVRLQPTSMSSDNVGTYYGTYPNEIRGSLSGSSSGIYVPSLFHAGSSSGFTEFAEAVYRDVGRSAAMRTAGQAQSVGQHPKRGGSEERVDVLQQREKGRGRGKVMTRGASEPVHQATGEYTDQDVADEDMIKWSELESATKETEEPDSGPASNGHVPLPSERHPTALANIVLEGLQRFVQDADRQQLRDILGSRSNSRRSHESEGTTQEQQTSATSSGNRRTTPQRSPPPTTRAREKSPNPRLFGGP